MRRERQGGGCTVVARSHVNPGDPLRARATLLLGSGGSAHLYIFSHFHYTLRARAYVCQAGRHTAQRLVRPASDFRSHTGCLKGIAYPVVSGFP